MAIQLPPFVGALKGINIPPGDGRYTITDSFVVPSDLLAFAVGAHAHYIGKELKMTATLPNRTERAGWPSCRVILAPQATVRKLPVRRRPLVTRCHGSDSRPASE